MPFLETHKSQNYLLWYFIYRRNPDCLDDEVAIMNWIAKRLPLNMGNACKESVMLTKQNAVVSMANV